MRTSMQVGLAGIVFAGLAAACSSPATGTAAGSTSMANSCIRPTEIARQTIISDQEIRFEMRNGETWVNKLHNTCPNLKFEQAFSWDVHGSLVCSNQQTIRVKDNGATCILGEFSKLPPAQP